MILSEALRRHRGAMRASLRAEYGIDLRNPGIGWDDAADLVAWLPPASALWVSFGGPMTVSVEAEILRWLDYRLKVLAWQPTKDGHEGRNQPSPPKKIKAARERDVEDEKTSARAAAWQRRQELRAAHART